MIYLDNAATTFPKPPCVAQEIVRCIQQYCGNPGRSGHVLSIKAAEKVYECREALAFFFGASSPEKVVFTYNTTYAINIAIQTLYVEGAHVLIGSMEHNSVLRPISELQKSGKISYSIFNALQSADSVLQTLQSSLRKNTKMLIVQHASNICGHTVPIRRIGKFCKKHGITFIVDAAQSAGLLPIHIEQDCIDALCVPAHKGLYGPQGLGMVIFGEKDPLRPFICGGNGILSAHPDMGTTLPESLEGGTVSTPLIAGLHAALKWLQAVGVSKIRNHEAECATRLADRLLSLKGSFLYGPSPPSTGILLYKNQRYDSQTILNFLDKKRICVRGGLHCTPMAHNALGTGNDGAIRFSFGFFNSTQDSDAVYAALREFGI